jgi:acyl-CoA thioester hydrolase
MTAPDGPLHLLDLAVEPAWIDYNGHMNMGYYLVAYDRATDELLDHLGMDAGYRQASGCSIYVLEVHLCYERELRLGDRARVDVQIIDHDAKRIHCFMRMHRHGDDELAATGELMLMHVALGNGRATPMPESVAARVRALAASHGALARPPHLGRAIGIRHR